MVLVEAVVTGTMFITLIVTLILIQFVNIITYNFIKQSWVVSFIFQTIASILLIIAYPFLLEGLG